MNAQTLGLFVAASLALAVTPGPTMLLALANGLNGGWRAAVGGILGASLGAAVLIAAVALGLGSLLAASQLLFEIVRWLGVAYLVWIGVKLWRSRPASLAAALGEAPAQPDVTPTRAFVRSLGVALSNPKTLLFFAAFLPQFVDTAQPQAPQFALLGAVFIGLDAGVMLAYALAGSHAVRWLSARGLLWLNRGCAAGMWALAALLAAWRRGGA